MPLRRLADGPVLPPVLVSVADAAGVPVAVRPRPPWPTTTTSARTGRALGAPPRLAAPPMPPRLGHRGHRRPDTPGYGLCLSTSAHTR